MGQIELFLSETSRSINSTSNKLTAVEQMHVDYNLTNKQKMCQLIIHLHVDNLSFDGI